MAEARPGDFVISYANGLVSDIGIISDRAVKSPKPSSFGQSGDSWLDYGWRLSVSWYKVDRPVSTKKRFEDIRSLLREKYSPISLKDGSGNQGCYLAEIDKPLFVKICELSGFDDTGLQVSSGSAPLSNEDYEDTLEEEIVKSGLLSDTEVIQLRKSRKGQGEFRRNVFDLISLCPITGVSLPELLIASHIKPWKDCSSVQERLDGHNGLPLSPAIDSLFDKGFISFDDNGQILLSDHLPVEVAQALGINDNILSRKLFKVSNARANYLQFHRENCFRH